MSVGGKVVGVEEIGAMSVGVGVSVGARVSVGVRVSQGHQDPSKSVSIFLRETEALIKMVSIWPVSISRSRTVYKYTYCIYNVLSRVRPRPHVEDTLRLRVSRSSQTPKT